MEKPLRSKTTNPRLASSGTDAAQSITASLATSFFERSPEQPCLAMLPEPSSTRTKFLAVSESASGVLLSFSTTGGQDGSMRPAMEVG